MLRTILHTPILNFQTLALTLLLTRGTMLLHTLISVTPQENAPKRIRTLLSMVFMAMMYVHPGASLSHIVGTTQNNIFLMADYVRIFPPEVCHLYKVPSQVDMPQGVLIISADSTGSSTGLSFLTAGSDKALPRYIQWQREGKYE